MKCLYSDYRSREPVYAYYVSDDSSLIRGSDQNRFEFPFKHFLPLTANKSFP